MTRKWSEVVTQEAFINLSPEERNEAQAAYFSEVIAPQVPIQEVNQVKEEFYSEYPEATSGLLGAVGSSVDRLQAGAYQLMGNQEAAEDNLRESRAYVPSVRSYKDIGNITDLGEYVGEGLAQGLPYMAMLAANPVAATAGAAGLTALEAGATYAEQEDKSVGNAIASATANTLLERIGLTGANTFLRKGLQDTITEAGIGGAQHLVTNMIGHGQSFNQARQNIDEAIMGSAIQRATVKAASKVPDVLTNTTQLARDNIPVLDEALTKREEVAEERIEEDRYNRSVLANNEESVTKTKDNIVANVNQHYATNKNIKLVENGWQRINEQNTIDALHKLKANGAALTPSALDITVKRFNQDGEQTYSLAEQYGLKGKAKADTVAKTIAESATTPFLGDVVDLFVDNPRKNYAQSKQALTKMKDDLDTRLDQVNLSKQTRKEIDKYVSESKGKLSETAITEVMDNQGMQLLNALSEQKQAFKMVDNMKVSDESLASVAKGTASTLGVDFLLTGGLATGLSTLAGAGSRVLSNQGKKQLDTLLAGIEPEQRENVIKTILGNIDSDKLSKMGIENEYELEGEE